MNSHGGAPGVAAPRVRKRVYLGSRHYPAYAPRVLWHSFTHWAIGPLLGCSCSRCFRSRWRIAYSNSVIDRFVKNERRVRHVEDELKRLLPNYKRSFP